MFLVSSLDMVSKAGVGEPFLDQEIRYHCPVYCLLKYIKPSCHSFKRRIWKYSEGNYEVLREKISSFDWSTCSDDNIDSYASKLTDKLLDFCGECIPNKIVTIRTSDPPWFHNDIRKMLRRRKRAYKKAKSTNNPIHIESYKQLRNQTNHLVRSAKKDHFDKLASALQNTTDQSDFWKLIKNFTRTSTTNRSIPTLVHNNTLYEDTESKANILISSLMQSRRVQCSTSRHRRTSRSAFTFSY